MALTAAITSIFPIIAIILIGYVLCCLGIATKAFADGIAKVLIDIAMPCAVIVSVTTYMTTESLPGLYPGLICIAVTMLLWYGLAFVWTRLTQMAAGRRGAFIAGVANTNTLFIGWPLNQALFGEEAMPYYLAYLLICNVSTWTIGWLCILEESSEAEGHRGLRHLEIKKLFPPPVIGFIIGLALLFSHIHLPLMLASTMSYLGALVTPLSLLFIGISLANAGIRSVRIGMDTVSAVAARLAAGPALMLAVIVLWEAFFPGFSQLEWQTYLVQSATPIMAVLPILVHEAGGDVLYANNIVTVSTLLFVATITGLVLLLGI